MADVNHRDDEGGPQPGTPPEGRDPAPDDFGDDGVGATSSVEGMPPDIVEPRTSEPDDGAADPRTAAWVGAPEPADTGDSPSSRVQIGTGSSGIVADSDLVPGAASAARDVADPEEPDEGLRFDDLLSLSDEAEDVAEWRDPAPAAGGDTGSESVGFGAFVAPPEGGAAGAASESFAGDSQGIGDPPGEAIDLGIAPIARRGGRTAADRRPAGGLGQLLGVVLGGVLAIPVTLAILVWGFQRDPLGVTRSVPEPVRFLLPAKFRGVRPRPPRSLDEVAAAARDLSPTEPPAPVAVEEPAVAAAVEPSPGEAHESVTDPGPAAPATPVDDVPIAIEAPPVKVSPEPPAAPDTATLDEALRAASAADAALDAIPPDADAAVRERALVAWYRSLAAVALEASVAERAAADGGGDPGFAAARCRSLLSRTAERRRTDLETLGGMWIDSGTRPSEGAVLVVTLENVRRVGPWWGGRLLHPGEPPRTISFLARGAPAVPPGEAAVVFGVLVDPATMWIVDAERVGNAGRSVPEDVAPE